MMIKKKLLNFLYPNFCPACGEILFSEEQVCEACGEAMLLGQDEYCHKCGKISCMCKYRKSSYDNAVVACRYDETSSPAVVCLKESRNTNFAYFAARILAERLQYAPYYNTRFDFVMPVPMHPSKQRLRGYNQAALIAMEIARLLNLSYREDVLYKEKTNVAQHMLSSAQERAKNVDSFGAYDISLKNMKILLCDDVLTTGSTMNRCAEYLKKNGAASVTVAAACATTPPQKKETKE